MGLFVAVGGWGQKGTNILCHAYPTMIKLGTFTSYTLPKEDPKYVWITLHAIWALLTSAFFTGN